MAYEKLVELAKALYQKTEAREIEWEATARENAYQASLPNYSLVIEKQYDPDSREHYVVLRILNEQGWTIEELFEGQAVSGGFRGLPDLFERARRIAMAVEKALDEILEALKR